MNDKNQVVKLAIDYFHGKVQNYSNEDAAAVLREALIEANNGKDYLDIRDVRDGKCSALFAIVEEILDVTIPEGLQGNEFFMNFVEYRNVAEGDKIQFVIEDSELFEMAEIADGTQALRRQRLSGVNTITIPTKTYGVRIYEELNRVLANRVDFNQMINKVSETFQKYLMEEIYELWRGATAEDMGGATYFPVAGTGYDEDTLLDLVEHVEAAANGNAPVIVGTMKALRKLKTDMDFVGNEIKSDMYNSGVVAKWNGYDVVRIPQRHKEHTNGAEWLLDDNSVTVIAGSHRPIKIVNEGSPLVLYTQSADNYDLTTEFTFIQKWGMALVTGGVNTGLGRYILVNN